MAGRYDIAIDSGTAYSDVFWVPTSLGVYYSFSPGGSPGVPLLTAKDANGNIILVLSTLPNTNGDYVTIGSGVFVSSDGVYTVPAGQWLQRFLSPATTTALAGQVLTYQLDFTPPGQTSPVRLISSDSRMVFSGNNAADCSCAGGGGITDIFNTQLFNAGYSIPFEDDWRGSTTPPTSPVVGGMYVVPLGATGAWLGKAGQVASWSGAVWSFTVFPSGTTAYVRNRHDRMQCIDFNYIAGLALNNQTFTSSASCVAWVPDYVLEQIKGAYSGIIESITTTPPVTPGVFDQYIVGNPEAWPVIGDSDDGCVALAVVDQSTNSVVWVYRRPNLGEQIPGTTNRGNLAYVRSLSEFVFYDPTKTGILGSHWSPIGSSIFMKDLADNLAVGAGTNGYVPAWNNTDGKFELVAQSGGGGGGGGGLGTLAARYFQGGNALQVDYDDANFCTLPSGTTFASAGWAFTYNPIFILPTGTQYVEVTITYTAYTASPGGSPSGTGRPISAFIKRFQAALQGTTFTPSSTTYTGGAYPQKYDHKGYGYQDNNATNYTYTLSTGRFPAIAGDMICAFSDTTPTSGTINDIVEYSIKAYGTGGLFPSGGGGGGGGGVTHLYELLDVNVTEGSATNGYVLTWNNATSKWIAAPVSGGGGGTNTVLSGSGAPSSGTGNNGDFYIDYTNHVIYGPKTSGAWGTGTSLVGPQGATGATGPASTVPGPQGPAGPLAGTLNCSYSVSLSGSSPTFTQVYNNGWGTSPNLQAPSGTTYVLAVFDGVINKAGADAPVISLTRTNSSGGGTPTVYTVKPSYAISTTGTFPVNSSFLIPVTAGDRLNVTFAGTSNGSTASGTISLVRLG